MSLADDLRELADRLDAELLVLPAEKIDRPVKLEVWRYDTLVWAGVTTTNVGGLTIDLGAFVGRPIEVTKVSVQFGP